MALAKSSNNHIATAAWIGQLSYQDKVIPLIWIKISRQSYVLKCDIKYVHNMRAHKIMCSYDLEDTARTMNALQFQRLNIKLKTPFHTFDSKNWPFGRFFSQRKRSSFFVFLSWRHIAVLGLFWRLASLAGRLSGCWLRALSSTSYPLPSFLPTILPRIVEVYPQHLVWPAPLTAIEV